MPRRTEEQNAFRRTPEEREKANAYARKWRAENRDHVRELEKLHRGRRKDGINARRRERHAANPRIKQEQHRKALYGISPQEQRAMLEAQHNKCAICQAEFNFSAKRSYAVDHNHATGKVRSFLCISCNSALGLVKEDPDILKEMLRYLEVHDASS